MRNKIILIILLLATSVLLYNYVYQDHRNIETEQPEYVINVESIIDEFENNTKKAEEKYINKTIQLSGIITEINSNNLTLNNSVFCQFSENHSEKVNSEIKIKGRCIGYDDLLEQVKLDQCIIIN